MMHVEAVGFYLKYEVSGQFKVSSALPTGCFKKRVTAF